MPSTRTSYQTGSISRATRAKGPDLWVFRWRETLPDGQVVRRNRILGDVDTIKSKAAAQKTADAHRVAINSPEMIARSGYVTLDEVWVHFQKTELKRESFSPTTVQGYKDFVPGYILPRWGAKELDQIKAVAVENWLATLQGQKQCPPKPLPPLTKFGNVRRLRTRHLRVKVTKPLMNGTKAKIRALMYSLYQHAIRHELYDKLNPISTVRQSGKRSGRPDLLTRTEISAIRGNIKCEAIRVMFDVAAATAFRRSEFLGLKWEDVDLDGLWFDCKRGLVGKSITKMKTEASRAKAEMSPAIAKILAEWRTQTPYNQDSDWVFASPYTNGKRPYWPDTALKRHVLPAARAAGIHKKIGWHTFRHSLGTLLNDEGENIKIIQEVLRHASPRITIELYQQGNSAHKRNALDRMSSIFSEPPPNG